MSSDETFWYKDAIIYELHVRCFFDSDNNGIGDFNGLTQKLDYLQDLGVTAIWLLPFYPSPLKDDGYDISDYLNIHSHYGTLHDFKIFLREAHRRGLKVITELVVNHTSDQHPWFKRARNSKPESRFRDFYVWSETQDKYTEARVIFQDFESSNWGWDPIAKSYYWHRFYSHQPDLNFENPEVVKAIERILAFWLSMGVDGVRLDAVPYLFEKEGTNCENLPETHEFLKQLRKVVDSRFKDRMFLAEANQWPEDAAKYFGSGDECQMAFHFPLMPRLFMSIHLEDSLPIIEIFKQTPQIPENCQWALFLRNHDELTLEMVTDEERDYMFRVYAFDPQARINLGIRRRLAPLLKNDRRKIELMNSLLFSLSGTPVIYYGDEIGMGDNIYLGDRNGVRTPMQWSNDRNAGFSQANPQSLYLPPIIDPEYHFETVNVEAQQNNPHSLLWWTKQLIALRKRFKAFSYGTTQFLKPENKKVLVFVREYQEELILIVSNLSRFSQFVELDLSQYNGFHPIELFSGGHFPKIGELPYFLTLGPYGYYWFALEKEPQETPFALFEKTREKQVFSLSLRREAESFFGETQRRSLDTVLRMYLLKRIWFQKSFLSIDKTKTKIVDLFTFSSENYRRIYLVVLQIAFSNGIIEKYPFFLALIKGEASKKILLENPERVLMKFKEEFDGTNEGILYDVGENVELSNVFLDFITKQRRLKGEKGELQGLSFEYLHEKNPFLNLGKKEGSIQREKNSLIFPAENQLLKIFTVLEEGIDSDVDVRLFLTKYTSFRGFPPLLGFIRYKDEKNVVSLAAKFASYPDEFNAKLMAIQEAERFFIKLETEKKQIPDKILVPSLTLIEFAKTDADSSWLTLLQGFPQIAKQLGEMAGEYHLALASSVDDKDFAPVSYTFFYQRSLYQTLMRRYGEGFSILRSMSAKVSEEVKKEISEVINIEEKVLKFLNGFLREKLQVQRLRYHGQFVLENLLYTGKEFLIADFSGNLQHSYSRRKYKRCPLVDVAAMLHSFTEASFGAVKNLQEKGLLNGIESKQRTLWAGSWALWNGSIFLRAYFEKVKGASFISSNEKTNDFLLGVFLLEKCLEKNPEEEKLSCNSLDVTLFLISHLAKVYRGFLSEEGKIQ